MGKGHFGEVGPTGAGHGGTSGRTSEQAYTGQPYGDLYDPSEMGSSGGTAHPIISNKITYIPGGRGGGIAKFNLTYLRVCYWAAFG